MSGTSIIAQIFVPLSFECVEILEIKEDIGAEPREKGICVFHQQRRSYGDGNTA